MWTHWRVRPPFVPRPAAWTIVMEFLVFYYLPAASSIDAATPLLSVHLLTTHAFLLLTVGTMMRAQKQPQEDEKWSIRKRLRWTRDEWPHLLLLLLTLFFVLLLSLLRQHRQPPLDDSYHHDLGGLDGRIAPPKRTPTTRDARVRIRPCPEEDRLSHVDVLLACDATVSRAHPFDRCGETVWRLEVVEVVLHPSTRCTPRHVRISFPRQPTRELVIRSAPHPHTEGLTAFPLVLCPATVTFAPMTVDGLDASTDVWTLAVEGFDPTTRPLRAEWQDARWTERPSRLYLAPLRLQQHPQTVGGHVLFRWTTFWHAPSMKKTTNDPT